MKSWLKGGLIFFFISWFVVVFAFIIGKLTGPTSDISIYHLLVFFIIFPVILFLEAFGLLSSLPSGPLYQIFVPATFASVLWFIFGAIIGWIVGKVKSRKQSSLKQS